MMMIVLTSVMIKVLVITIMIISKIYDDNNDARTRPKLCSRAG
jgi:1,4-dihydroxy-2-naphthoate octaprenyltransferase